MPFIFWLWVFIQAGVVCLFVCAFLKLFSFVDCLFCFVLFVFCFVFVCCFLFLFFAAVDLFVVIFVCLFSVILYVCLLLNKPILAHKNRNTSRRYVVGTISSSLVNDLVRLLNLG